MHADHARPIWLNEFAAPPYKHASTTDQLALAQKVVPKLEALPYLFRYAWFEARADGNETLLVPAGPNATGPPAVALTPLGAWYNAFTP